MESDVKEELKALKAEIKVLKDKHRKYESMFNNFSLQVKKIIKRLNSTQSNVNDVKSDLYRLNSSIRDLQNRHR